MITKKEFQTITHSADRAGKQVTFETWKLAPHCDGSTVITLWETQLLVTAVMEKKPDSDKDYMPLAIDFRESRYAAGKIWWWRFNKREWRPSDIAVLYARLTDRPLRPMFPKGMVNDVIVTISPLSLDREISPWELSIIGASASILMWGIPFDGPVWAIRIWYKDWNFIPHMTDSQSEGALLDLHLAWKKWSINMIEAGANECSPEVLKEAMTKGQELIDQICDIQQAFLDKLTIETKQITKNRFTDEQFSEAKNILTDEKLEWLQIVWKDKAGFDSLYSTLQKELIDGLEDNISDSENEWTTSKAKIVMFNSVKKYFRNKVLSGQPRVDGRSLDQIRQIYCETNVVPRTHGTGLFWRWDTQVLSFLTLWSPSDAQLIDGMEDDSGSKRFIHHYKFPPFSNNEARMIRWSNRRETGHGRLAEKALERMIPEKDVFPYTLRLVSECLWSGWSTSMAAVCGSTLALMSGWVPIKEPVSGIAMGMMSDDSQQIILTDIKWTEDFIWDMDFKLTGTKNWVTAIQMDTKLKGCSVEKLHEMIDKANWWRQEILEYMLTHIAEPNSEMSPYAPSIEVHKIQPEQVRSVIWPGWSMITKIIEEAWGPELVSIDFEDDGTTFISAKDQEAGKKARSLIQWVLREPKKWDKMKGTITRTEAYGVFADIWSGKIGLVHVKNLGQWFIEDASKLFKVWDTIQVEVIGIEQGKIQLKKAE